MKVKVTYPPPKVADPSPPPQPKPEPVKEEAPCCCCRRGDQQKSRPFSGTSILVGLVLTAIWGFLRFQSGTDMGPETNLFLQHLTVFALAVFVGWQVIWSVTAAPSYAINERNQRNQRYHHHRWSFCKRMKRPEN